jgi:uncharacterized protein YpuA (DUF1002 family)
VKADFAEIEREAAMADQLKVQAAEEAKVIAEKTAEEEQKQVIISCSKVIVDSAHVFLCHVDVGSVPGILETMYNITIIIWFVTSIC